MHANETGRQFTDKYGDTIHVDADDTNTIVLTVTESVGSHHETTVVLVVVPDEAERLARYLLERLGKS